MKTRNLSPLCLSVAIASLGSFGLVVPTSAYALPLQSVTSIVSFSNSASVTDFEGGGSTSNPDASLGTSAVARFDPTLGVLMGATINLASTRTQTVWVTSTEGHGTEANFDVTTNGSGSSTGRLAAPGVDSPFPLISASDSCTSKWKSDCIGIATTSAATTTNANAGVSGGDLDAYVGAGSVTVTRTAPMLTAEQSSNVFSGTESALYTHGWSGDLSATYDYLLHAAASFTDAGSQLVLDLDFGTVSLGDPASLAFSIFNLAGNRVGLDLDSIFASGDAGSFLLDPTTFTGLAAGASNNYLASLLTSIPGTFAASYLLTLSDADVGAAASRRNDFQMTLNLRGIVAGLSDPPGNEVEQPVITASAVPEPASLALVGLGLTGLGFVRRRKQHG